MASDLTEENRKYFNELASKYDIEPWMKEISRRITTYTQQQLDWVAFDRAGEDVSLLDYACGTGLMSRALGPYVNTIQALDLSSSMIERYRDLAASSSIAPIKGANARVGNLLTDQLTDQDLQGFSIAAICAALHHVADPGLAIKRLTERLRVGGVLLVVDFVEDAEVHHPDFANHTIHKHGFGRQEMESMMNEARLDDFGWKEMPDRVEMRPGGSGPIFRTVFLARAVRKSS